jgi:hypothetical protein
VNDPTTVHIFETKKDLLCNLANEMLWNAVLLITLDKAEEVFPEGFENHADVGAMGAFMAKVV